MAVDPDIIQRDYHRRFYAHSNQGYFDSLRTSPERAFFDQVLEENPELSEFGRLSDPTLGFPSQSQLDAFVKFIKHSEFKKTQGVSYQAMEFQWDGFPGFNMPLLPFPDTPWPKLPVPQNPFLEPTITVFDLESDDCYCVNQTFPITVVGTHTITAITLTLTDDPGTQALNINGLGSTVVTFDLQAGPTEKGPVTVEGSMVSPDNVIGSSNVNIPECRDTVCSAFTFILTRDDSVNVTPSILNFFQIVRGDGGGLSSFTQSYDAGTNTWTLVVTSGQSTNGLYWVRYGVDDDGVNYTQYPFKYKTADQDQAGDRITGGNYTDHVPYFKINTPWELVSPGEPIGACAAFTSPGCVAAPDPCSTPATPAFWHSNKASAVRWEANISSSVPYSLTLSNNGKSRVCQGLWDGKLSTGLCTAPSVCVVFSGIWGTLTETASDGLPVTAHNPSGPVLPAYNQNTVVAASIPGNNHFFQYTATFPDPFVGPCIGPPGTFPAPWTGFAQPCCGGTFDNEIDLFATIDF